ncbi:hypothetical protein EMPG_17511 [Blastomyces silverae]|uniref:Uncharacterized protein n=1 Tax=Blastomyces silverae TaxID=2060906 RepID=A0A0H1BCP0_9EURO|nr:hypothetical protein EMPG_17511 [Blastomyces silverae]
MRHLKILRCCWPLNVISAPRTCKSTWTPTCGRLALMESMLSTLARLGRKSYLLPASSQPLTTQPTFA